MYLDIIVSIMVNTWMGSPLENHIFLYIICNPIK